MWGLECGVLAERLVEADSAYDGLPTLFSLSHPLDDFCPVTCCRKPTTNKSEHTVQPCAFVVVVVVFVVVVVVVGGGVNVVGFFGEPGVEVLNVCREGVAFPLVITYNSTTLQHSLWALQTATSQVCLCSPTRVKVQHSLLY